jgi:SAM-dependent methyltransferase
VLRFYLTELTALLHAGAEGLACAQCLAVGAGTAPGTLALLDRFPAAQVTALDISAGMLARVERAARERGLADRLVTREVDLDGPWPALESMDLARSAASLHHLTDPDRALRQVLAVLRPGGLLAVTEMASFPRFLPDDIGLGSPGLEERCRVAVTEDRAERMPHFGADWGPPLVRAGFVVEAHRVLTVALDPPLPDATRRAAQLTLQRMREGLADRLSAEDLATLDTLVTSAGPEGVLQREDLRVRASRPVWVARRP